jgi:hypothetical protein
MSHRLSQNKTALDRDVGNDGENLLLILTQLLIIQLLAVIAIALVFASSVVRLGTQGNVSNRPYLTREDQLRSCRNTKSLGWETGIEPATSGATVRCSAS